MAATFLTDVNVQKEPNFQGQKLSVDTDIRCEDIVTIADYTERAIVVSKWTGS